MSYSDDYEYYEPEPTEADEAFDSLKESVFATVKQEVKDELERLGKENRDLKEKAKNIDQLEAEARRTLDQAERIKSSAKSDAKREVQQEGMHSLLALMSEPRFKCDRVGVERPKCDICDGDRRLHYKTPRGRDTYETCVCGERDYRWIVEEQFVQEVAKRNGEVMVWHKAIEARIGTRDRDSFGSANVLESAEGKTLAELVENPYGYGFSTREAAQVVADAANEKDDAQ